MRSSVPILLGFVVVSSRGTVALFCVGEEGGLVEDTTVVMEWGRLGVGAGGALARRRPLAKALRLREGFKNR